MQEIWKDIRNYEGLYQVSNLGRVKSTPICKYKKPKILKNIPRSGYFSVLLCVEKVQKNVFVHRLVAEAFVSNPENKPIVNHIDGNKHNNSASNLEWCTYKENTEHAIINGLFLSGQGKPIYQFDKNGNLLKQWSSVSEISNSLNVKAKSINNCIYGERKTAYGYIWSKNSSFFEHNQKYKRKTNYKSTKSKPKILQCDFSGNLIKTFSSQSEASKKTGISQSGISLCLSNKKENCGGFLWKYEDE